MLWDTTAAEYCRAFWSYHCQCQPPVWMMSLGLFSLCKTHTDPGKKSLVFSKEDQRQWRSVVAFTVHCALSRWGLKGFVSVSHCQWHFLAYCSYGHCTMLRACELAGGAASGKSQWSHLEKAFWAQLMITHCRLWKKDHISSPACTYQALQPQTSHLLVWATELTFSITL